MNIIININIQTQKVIYNIFLKVCKLIYQMRYKFYIFTTFICAYFFLNAN